MISRIVGTVATGAIALGVGFATAPSALADSPNSEESPELQSEITAEPWPAYAESDVDTNIAVTKILFTLDDYYEWDSGQTIEEQETFGSDLTDALYEMQAERNIGENGEIHGEVWDYLVDRQFTDGADWGPGGGRDYYDSGDRGWSVGAIQRMLITHGYLDEGANTGTYDDATKAAVEAFQGETCRDDADPEDPQDGECLDEDGLTGELTWRALVTGGLGPA